MSSRYHETPTVEMAMRVMMLVIAEFRTETDSVTLVEIIRDRFNVSRATAYRYLGTACDVLGIVIESPAAKKLGERARVPVRSHPWREQSRIAIAIAAARQARA